MGKRKRCRDGKLVHPTFDDAVHAAVGASKLRGVALRPYDCSICGGWHLTKMPDGPVVATVPAPFTPSDLARIVTIRSEDS